MFQYIVRRVLIFIPTIFLIAVIGFITMELPQGDYVTRYIMQLEASGQSGARERGAELRKVYQLDDPAYVRFVTWISPLCAGEFRRFILLPKARQGTHPAAPAADAGY